MLIDSHAHISYFEKYEQLEIIQNAFANGVGLINNISTNVNNFDALLASCHGFENVYCTVGTHPCNVQEEPHITHKTLVEIAKNHKKVIGIGETGLDFFHDETHKELQIHQFWEHILAAVELQMPIIVHTRNAEDETLRILTKAREQFGNDLKILIHCFTGGVEFCEKLLKIDSYISYSGIITFKNAKEIVESLLITPENRLIIETDSPFLAPEPMRGKKNQPAFVKFVAERIAILRKTVLEEVIRASSQNFCGLFGVNPV